MSLRSLSLFLIAAIAAPLVTLVPTAEAASLSRNAWIPYWSAEGGIGEARAHLDDLTSVNPFSYEVDASGKLIDKLNLSSDLWQDFLDDAQDAGVAVYPTVAWFDGQAMHDVLSNNKKRKKHVDAVMRILKADSTIDGIDIDYEGKLAATNPHFSRFLQDLKKKLKAKKKKLICTIEPRTPLQDRYVTVTPAIAASVAYANDYAVIGSVCDEVRVMTYDQGLADVTLVRSGSRPYAPVSDPAWVRKVVASTTTDIPANKIVTGIPTYGRVWRIDPNTGGYTMISSITYTDAMALAARQGVTPTRNRSGELSFSYTGLTSGLPGTAKPTGGMNGYFVSFNDETSIAGHVALAKRLGLSGVSLFKLDGKNDPSFWAGFLR